MTEPNGELLARVTELIATSMRVEKELAADRQAREAEKVAQEKKEAALEERMRTNRVTARIAIAVGIIAVSAGIAGIGFGYEARATANDLVKARTNSRVVACMDANRRSTDEHQLWEGLLLLPPRPPDPAKVEAFIAIVGDQWRDQVTAVLSTSPQDPTQVAALRALLDRTFPTRDCSAAAVNAFYNGGH